jgi:uncharacterized protein YkwD
MIRSGRTILLVSLTAALAACASRSASSRSTSPSENAPQPEAELGESTAPPQDARGDLPAPPAPSAAPATGAGASDLQLCVDEVNRYRKKLGLRALRRLGDLEKCAAEGARADHASGQPHAHFLGTQGCGIAFAENEIPKWPIDYAGGVTNTIKKGIADMWAEGPGGGHYENMKGDYTELGCGIFVDGSSITVVQDYK